MSMTTCPGSSNCSYYEPKNPQDAECTWRRFGEFCTCFKVTIGHDFEVTAMHDQIGKRQDLYYRRDS